MDLNIIKQKVMDGIYEIKPKNRDETGRKRKFSGMWKIVHEIWHTDDNNIAVKIDGFVVCSKCLHVMRYVTKNGSSSILNHIEKQENSIQNNQPISHSMNPISACDKQKILNAGIKFVTEDLRPYKAVEGTGFFHLIEAVWNLGAKMGTVSQEKLAEILPTRQTISNNIKLKADRVRDKLKLQLNEVYKEYKSIPMTIDIWSDKYKHISYVGITAHFYDGEWNLCDQYIGLQPLDADETKDHVYVREMTGLILDKYELKDKLSDLVFVSDRGGNVCASLSGSIRLNCMTHFINNVVKAACQIDTVNRQIAECKSLVTYFKISGLNSLLDSSLKQALDIRFNSVCNMFDSILKNRSKVKDLLEARNEDKRIENIHFNHIQSIFTFLNEFRHWSNVVSASKTPILYFVWLAYDKLLKHSTPKNSDASYVSLMKTKAYQYMEEKFVLHELHRIATFLHPNFKSLKFVSNQMRIKTIDDTKTLLNRFHPNAERLMNRRASSCSHSSIESALSSYFDEDEPIDEVEEYTSLKCPLEINLDLIKWWRERGNLFPLLSKLALWIHSIPASSIPSERKFSSAGSIICEKRSNLKPDSIENILLLHGQRNEN